MPGVGTEGLLELVDHTFTTTTSVTLVLLLNLLLPLGLCAAAAFRWLDFRRKLRLSERQTASALLDAPRPGPGAAHGRVELAPGSDVAFQLRIEQVGSQVEKEGRIHHTWSEQRREVSHAPFHLTDGDRRVVRVEPSTETDLVDEPTRTIVHSPTQRTRILELEPGEEIYALGNLVASLDPNEPLSMRAPPGGRLLLSTRPLPERFRGWTRYHGIFVIVFATLVALPLLLHIPFFQRLSSGEAGEGRIVAFETANWSGGKGNRVACWITVARPDGLRMRAELNRAVEKGTYAESPCEKFVTLGDRVPVVFVRGADGVDQFGREPGAHQAVVVGFGVLAIAALFIYLALPRMFPSKHRRFDERGEGPLTA
jgi:hypothetical protein